MDYGRDGVYPVISPGLASSSRQKLDESTKVDWVKLFSQEDIEGLWDEPYRLLLNHPTAHPLYRTTEGNGNGSHREVAEDLAHEVFLELFHNHRFAHYINRGYSSADIESHLACIEVPYLVAARSREHKLEDSRSASYAQPPCRNQEPEV